MKTTIYYKNDCYLPFNSSLIINNYESNLLHGKNMIEKMFKKYFNNIKLPVFVKYHNDINENIKMKTNGIAYLFFNKKN
jgi:hypothetical protein